VRIGLAELADGLGELCLDAHGRPDPALVVVDLDGADWRLAPRLAGQLAAARTPVLVGVASEVLPGSAEAVLQELTCTLSNVAGGATLVHVVDVDDEVDRIRRNVEQSPVAAATLVSLLRLTARAPVADGLVAESLAYSTLLAGEEFAAWRARTPRRSPTSDDRPVLVERRADELVVTLNRPERHNAFGRSMRDHLIAALDVAHADTDVRVLLRGNGLSFCSGGDLDEFGTATDPAVAHLVRIRQSAAWSLHRLADRLRVDVHGACIGAGLELPSFAAQVLAREDASFRLPEIEMGLVPGAGGTVSVTRRIGRWRTAYLALSGVSVDVTRALDWGLVDGRA